MAAPLVAVALTALLVPPAAASKAAQAGSQRQAEALDRASGRLVRSEADVSAGAHVMLDFHDSAPLQPANCTMAQVFGPDNKTWPTTIAQAKEVQMAYCVMRGYSNATCQGVIDVHFQNNPITMGAAGLVMTPTFCEESVKLLQLDVLHSGSGPPPTFLLETYLQDGEASLDFEAERRWPWSSCSSQTCSNGEAKVRHSWWGGCVCPFCKGHSWRQLALCQRRCKVGDSNCAQCFPSSAAVTVQLRDGAVATRTMEQLRVGDSVYTGGGFSRIFAFMDHVSRTEAEYVQLRTATGHELSLTADHIVYAHAEQTPVLAGTITEGDLLWTASGVEAEFVPSRVVRVQHGLERGMHAPLTEQGSVVVNGVLSSSYAKVKSLHWGARVLVSGHDLNRYMHEPLRFACSLLPRLCDREWHSAEGRHVWTQLILDRLGWLQAMNSDHSDIRSALVTDPSASSWLAGFAQLGAAALLSATFGQASRVTLLAVGAAALAAARRGGAARKA